MSDSVGSVSVDVVPDATKFRRELAAKLADLTADVRAELDDKKLEAELDKATRPREVKVRVNDQGSAGKTSRDLKLLSTAIVGLAPAVAPFAGAIAGVTAAVGGLGVAGILAVKGISDEMKAGTPLGLRYAAMLQGAKGDLTKLEKVASQGVLTGFDHSLGDVEGAMPKLREEIGILSNSLGSDLGPVTHGVLSLFLQLSPVMNDLAGGVHTLATDFDSWASGPGGREFVAYIAKVLPEVGQTLGDVAQAGAHVVDALLPLGGPVLKSIQGIATAIDHIPVSVIQDLFIAFTAYRTVNLATAAVEGFTGAMVKLGLVEKGIGAAGVVGGAGKGAAAGLGARAIGLLGPIGATAAVGIGLGALADQQLTAHGAKLDNRAASRIVAGGVSGFNAARSTQGQQISQLTGLQQLSQSRLAAGDVQGSLALTPKIQQLQTKVHDLGVALSLANPQIKDLQAANKAAGLTADGTRDAITGEAVSLAQMVQAQDKLAAANQAAIGSTIGYHQALADANKALKDNGKTLNENTQKGRDNQTALLNLGQALRAHADAEAAVKTNTADANAVLANSHDELIKVAEKFGLSATKARAYADEVLGLPAIAKVTFGTPGLNQAIRGVTTLNGLLETAYTLGGKAGAAAAQATHGQFGASGVPNVVITHPGSPSGPGSAPGAPKKKKKALGGLLVGAGTGTSDQIPFLGSNREFLVREAAVQKVGIPFLNQLNQTGQVPATQGGPGMTFVNSGNTYYAIDEAKLAREQMTQARKALAVAGIR